MIDVGIAALPVLAKFQRARRQGLCPALRPFYRNQVIITKMGQFVLVKQVVFEEVDDMQSPLNVNLLTVGALEDRADRILRIDQGLGVGEAPCFGNPGSR